MSYKRDWSDLQEDPRKFMVYLIVRACDIFLCFVSSDCSLIHDFLRWYNPEKLPFVGLLGLLFSLSYLIREFGSYEPKFFHVLKLCRLHVAQPQITSVLGSQAFDCSRPLAKFTRSMSTFRGRDPLGFSSCKASVLTISGFLIHERSRVSLLSFTWSGQAKNRRAALLLARITGTL
mgnify:CR=1 FL=1